MTLTLSGCETVNNDTDLIPAIVVPTVQERKIMREHIPDFYVRFTVQQAQILKAMDNPPTFNFEGF